MKRLVLIVVIEWLGMAGIAAAQTTPGVGDPSTDLKQPQVTTVLAPVSADVETAETVPAPTEPVAAPPLTALPVTAAVPTPPPAPVAATPSPGEGPSSAETQSYLRRTARDREQSESVYRAAVARAEQRTRRLESQRWFGISNARPMVSPDPYNGDYGPTWVSNNPYFPYRWVGGQAWNTIDGQY